MKKRDVVRELLLPALVGLCALWLLLDEVFLPNRRMPAFGLMAVIALSLLAQAVGVLVSYGGPRHYISAVVIGAVSFGLIPWCAGVGRLAPWLMALLGGGIYCLTEFLAGLICDRFGPGKGNKCAAFFSILLLYLAAQGFQGFL